jgi:tetratricopeptide (TPR) repeat protein
MGNYTQAVSTLDAALKLDPRDEYALYNKGLVLIRLSLHTYSLGDLGAALQWFDKALAINPDNKDVRTGNSFGQRCYYSNTISDCNRIHWRNVQRMERRI